MQHGLWPCAPMWHGLWLPTPCSMQPPAAHPTQHAASGRPPHAARGLRPPTPRSTRPPAAHPTRHAAFGYPPYTACSLRPPAACGLRPSTHTPNQQGPQAAVCAHLSSPHHPLGTAEHKKMEMRGLWLDADFCCGLAFYIPEVAKPKAQEVASTSALRQWHLSSRGGPFS